MKKILFLWLGLCALALPAIAGKVSTLTGVTVANDADTTYIIQSGVSKKIAAAHFRSNATHYGTTVLKGPVRRITQNIPTILNQPGVDLQDSHNAGESAWAVGSFIGGGSRNRVGTNNDQTISGDGAIVTGTANVILSGVGSDNVIGGGGNNKIETLTDDPGDFSTDCGIFSGLNNVITSSDASVIAGGDGNSINGFGNFIAGGTGNQIDQTAYAAILGSHNTANHQGAIAIGHALAAIHDFGVALGISGAAELNIWTNGGGGNFVEVTSGILFAKGGNTDAGKPAFVAVDSGTGGAGLVVSNSTVVANVLVVDGFDGALTSASLAGGTGNKLLMAPSTGKITSTGLNYFTGSATLDFASTSAQTSTDLTITVTGAASGDVVSIGVPNGSVLVNSSFAGWVSAANTVTVRFNNHSSTAKDPASGTFKVTVIHF